MLAEWHEAGPTMPKYIGSSLHHRLNSLMTVSSTHISSAEVPIASTQMLAVGKYSRPGAHHDLAVSLLTTWDPLSFSQHSATYNAIIISIIDVALKGEVAKINDQPHHRDKSSLRCRADG